VHLLVGEQYIVLPMCLQ